MKKPTLFFASLAMGGALLLSACSPAAEDDDPTTAAEVTDGAATEQVAADAEETLDIASLVEATYPDLDVEEMDLSISTAEAVEVALADGASSGGDGVSVEGDVITITQAGVYRLSGALSDGKVVVDADGEDVHLILDGVDITSSEAGAIEVVNADQVALHLASGTSNSVAEAAGTVESTDEDGANAAIYASSDLFITGDGALEVTGVAADGITSKDSLVIDSGTIAVTAADDGLRGKDHLVIRDGDITVESTGDGLRSDNVADSDEADKAVGVVWIEGGAIDVTTGADAVDSAVQTTITGGDLVIAAQDDAVHSDGILRVDGGSIDIESSYEGLEAAIILLSGGEAAVVASDDGINASDGSGGGEPGAGGMGGQAPAGAGGADGGGPPADGARPGRPGEQATTDATTEDVGVATLSAAPEPRAAIESDARVEISGGTWTIDAGGDGLDANGSVTMTGGTVVIAGPVTEREGAIDYDIAFTMDGGVLAASGAAGMAQAPSAGGQAVLAVNFGQTLGAGQTVAVLDADGDLVAGYTLSKDSQTLVLSSHDLVAGAVYTVVFDGDVTGSATAGLVTDGTLTGGDTAGTVEAG